MATIYDVAQKSNVSIATVSKVINNKGGVGEKTRKRVLEAMAELDYHPNLAASVLMGKNTKTIGLLIPDLANPYFSEIAKSIEDRAHNYGYNIIICSTEYIYQKERKYISLLKQKNVDGFIFVSGFENSEQISKLLEEKFPLIAVTRDFPMLTINSVGVDNYRGGYQAGHHFIQNGHENILIIGYDVWSNRERIRGFKDALSDSGREYNLHSHIMDQIEGDHYENGYTGIQQGMEKDMNITAVFAGNDLLAVGAVRGLKELSLSVPEDVSIIGFDNSKITRVIDPPLTTIAQPIQELGEKVMDMIIENIQNKDMRKRKEVLLPELVVRESVFDRTIENK
ncbi:LacI family DNA-binding transcriptional regulator [Corticicoccus populi]|uniref:LacI family DNA-binding transcriptional regulator n=1 Tax=Corticicoccus populi TaxID=1812821 RepID=A0ABW5X066_9STAP